MVAMTTATTKTDWGDDDGYDYGDYHGYGYDGDADDDDDYWAMPLQQITW